MAYFRLLTFPSMIFLKMKNGWLLDMFSMLIVVSNGIVRFHMGKSFW